MAVKCNIAGLVLNKLYSLQYGLECKNHSNAILENYIEYLDCEDLNFVPCSPNGVDCSDKAVVFQCRLTVKRIVIISKESNTIVYGVELIGGTAPYTYSWQFDISDFDPAGAINTDEATLTVKADKDLMLLVSPISVTVGDAEGCITTKACTLTPEGLFCNNNYQACPNISSLAAFSKATYCARHTGLVVTNT